jgi:hypothetical protein
MSSNLVAKISKIESASARKQEVVKVFKIAGGPCLKNI